MRKDLLVTKNNMRPSIWNMSDVDEMFEKAFLNPLSLFDELRLTPTLETGWFQPKVDVEENDQAYLLSVDLPGLRKEDIKVDLSENVLTISGERKREEEHKDKSGTRRYERSYGQFQRSFTLPQAVEAGKVEASMEDGVLRIALPKSETTKPRAIEVQSGKGGFFSKLIGSDKSAEKTTDETSSGSHH